MARPKPPGRSLEAVSNDGSRGMVVTRAASHRWAGTEFGLPAACDFFLTVAAPFGRDDVEPRGSTFPHSEYWRSRTWHCT